MFRYVDHGLFERRRESNAVSSPTLASFASRMERSIRSTMHLAVHGPPVVYCFDAPGLRSLARGFFVAPASGCLSPHGKSDPVPISAQGNEKNHC